MSFAKGRRLLPRRQKGWAFAAPDGDGHMRDVDYIVVVLKPGTGARTQGHGLGDGSFGSFACHSAALVGWPVATYISTMLRVTRNVSAFSPLALFA